MAPSGQRIWGQHTSGFLRISGPEGSCPGLLVLVGAYLIKVRPPVAPTPLPPQIWNHVSEFSLSCMRNLAERSSGDPPSPSPLMERCRCLLFESFRALTKRGGRISPSPTSFAIHQNFQKKTTTYGPQKTGGQVENSFQAEHCSLGDFLLYQK